RPKPPVHWEVNPVAERQRKLEEHIAAIGIALWNYAQTGKPVLVQDKETKAWSFRPHVLDEIVKAKMLDANQLTDPVGGKLTLEDVARVEKDFTAERFNQAATIGRMSQLVGPLVNHTQQRQAKWFKDGKWTIPETALAEAAKQHEVQASLND